MARVLTLCALALLPVSRASHSADSFLTVYGGDTLGAFGSELSRNSDGTYLLGLITDRGAAVARLTETGIVLWSRACDDFGWSLVVDSQELPGGDFLLVTNAAQSAGSPVGGSVARFSSDGASLRWRTGVSCDWQDFLQGTGITADGGVVILTQTGSNRFPEPDCPRTSGRYAPWIVKVDSGGVLSWQFLLELGATELWARHVVATVDGGVVIVGEYRPVAPDPPVPFAVKLASDGSLVWARDYYGMPMAQFGVRVIAAADGGIFFTGEVTYKLNAMGDVQWARQLGPKPFVYAAHELASGGLMLAGADGDLWTAGRRAVVLEFDAGGNLVRQKAMTDLQPPTDALGVVGTSDGGALVTGKDAAGNLVLWKLGPGLTFDSSCPLISTSHVTAGDLAVTSTSLPITVLPTTRTARPETLTPTILTLDQDTVCQGQACVLSGLPMTKLKATRAGTDVRLTWDADPVATGYNLWTVPAKADIANAHLGMAQATGVVNCAYPNPASSNACLDSGAIARGSLLHYQVRAHCDGGSEGP